MISIIVAIAENYAIGKKGDLLCHMPADLKHFKDITSGKTVMMGERTFFSLPKHPLPNRRNIVLTDVAGKTFEGAEAVYSIDEMVKKVESRKTATSSLKVESEEAFVIGGDWFGPEGEGFMRMNLACPRSVIEKACEAIVTGINLLEK